MHLAIHSYNNIRNFIYHYHNIENYIMVINTIRTWENLGEPYR